MDFADFPVSQNDLDRRIDKIIRIFIPSISLSLIYKNLRKGLIKVNGKKVHEDYRVQNGDIVNIASFLLSDDDGKAAKQEADCTVSLPPVAFQNQHLLILNKPYDVLVHGSSDSLDKAVLNYYKNNIKDNSLSFTPGPLHRLDRKTTGLLAFSLSLQGAHWFSEHIKDHSIQKYYAALVEGNVKQTEHWEDYIQKEENQTAAFKTVKASANISDEKEDKLASTDITPLAHGTFNGKPVTLIKLNIHTGRTHQIRAQSSLHKHPLLGDTAYGGTKLLNHKQDFFLQAFCLQIPENPVELPPEIKISLNNSFIKILNVCGIKEFVL